MKRARFFLLVCASCTVLAACGARERPLPRLPGPLQTRLHEPDEVLAAASAINLDRAAGQAIYEDGATTQRLWDERAAALHEATAALDALLAAPRIDAAAVDARAKEIVRLEGELKTTHLALLVRVHNHLTPAQRATLDTLAAPR